MNRFYLLCFITLFLSFNAISQDTIFKKDGTQIKAKVLEVMSEVVKYKKITNQDGPTYEVKKVDILKIVYPDGSVDDFSKEVLNTNLNQMDALQELMKASAKSRLKQNGKTDFKLNGVDYSTEYNQLSVIEVGRQQGVVLRSLNKSALVLTLTTTVLAPEKRIVLTFTLTENNLKPATFKPTSFGGNEFEFVDKRFTLMLSYENPESNIGLGVGNLIPINKIKKGEFIINSIDTNKRTISGTYQVSGTAADGGKVELEGNLINISY